MASPPPIYYGSGFGDTSDNPGPNMGTVHGPKPTFGVRTTDNGDQDPTGYQTLYPPGSTVTLPDGSVHTVGDDGRVGPVKPSDDGGGSSDVDWADIFWGSLGLPPDVVSSINDIFKKYPDFTQAQLIAQQYLRKTPWYAKTFPGIAQGIKAGLFTDETGYRDYVNRVNQIYKQYYGRNVTGDEITGYLTQGQNPDYVGKTFEGNAIADTEKPELQYEGGAFTNEGRLSDAELKAYGQEKAGIDTPLGQAVTVRMQKAFQSMQTLFTGKLATAGLSLGNAGLYAPGLQGTQQTTSSGGKTAPDIPA